MAKHSYPQTRKKARRNRPWSWKSSGSFPCCYATAPRGTMARDRSRSNFPITGPSPGGGTLTRSPVLPKAAASSAAPSRR